MIVTDPDNRFVTDAWLALVNSVITGANGNSKGDLLDQISYILFELEMLGIIDGGNIIQDNITSTSAVNLMSGIFSVSKSYI